MRERSGNPTIAVEARIQRGGLPSGVDGLWSIATVIGVSGTSVSQGGEDVSYTIDAGGFKTQIKAETPSEWFSAERFSRESEIGKQKSPAKWAGQLLRKIISYS